MSDIDAMAREHTELGLFICDALNEDDFNLEKDKDTIEFLIDVFENAHKDLNMTPIQVTEKKLMMKKEDILKAIKEVLTENTGLLSTIKGRTGVTKIGVVTPKEKEEFTKAGATITPMEEEAMVSLNDFVSYLANRLEQVWKLGTGKNPVNYEEMARFIATDLGLVKSVNEDLDLGHEDDEPHMIKSELYKVAKYALELYKMVDQFEGKGEVDFPAWWQSKITKATSMVSSAKHYLEFELAEPAMDQAVIGSETPIAEKLDLVGHEDEDIDNDGKENTKTDKYLKGRRVKIGAAIAQHSKKK